MAKFLKVEETYLSGRKHFTYINLENVSQIYSFDGLNTTIRLIGDDEPINVSIPLSDFMDLVNSAK